MTTATTQAQLQNALDRVVKRGESAAAPSRSIAGFDPIGPRVLIRKIEMGETKIGGVIIGGAENAWYPMVATVVHPGTGWRVPDSGERLPPVYAAGDTIALSDKWQGIKLVIAGVEHMVVPEQEILGKVQIVDAA